MTYPVGRMLLMPPLPMRKLESSARPSWVGTTWAWAAPAAVRIAIATSIRDAFIPAVLGGRLPA